MSNNNGKIGNENEFVVVLGKNSNTEVYAVNTLLIENYRSTKIVHGKTRALDDVAQIYHL